MTHNRNAPFRVSRAVTLIIILLIVVFGALIAYTMLSKRTPSGGNSSQVPAPQGERSGAQTGGAQGERGGAQGGGPQSGGQNRAATAVRAAAVFLGDIENRIVINGDVLARTQVALYPTVAGKLAQGGRLQIGDRVVQGQTVALVDPSRPGELYSLSPVVSTISGTVLSVSAYPGDTVSTQTAICVVGDLSSLLVETFVPERFSTQVRRGLAAQVRFDAMPEEVFNAEVEELSPVLDPASRTLRIRLRFIPGPAGRVDGRIKAGMFATVSLATTSRRGVLLVPRQAVINTYGSWIVFVIHEDNRAERREIRLGLESEEYFEALEGLAEGERVVSAGQNFLSHNDAVRIVE